MSAETFLGQILHDGKWLDYARGHEAESRKWQSEDPANRRVVDWIHKERILIPNTGERVEEWLARAPEGVKVNEWTVTRSVDSIEPGDRFIFDPEFGGEGEVLTAAGRANNLMGTRVLAVEELDFDLEFHGPTFLRMAPKED